MSLESKVGLVKGTADVLPVESSRLGALEALLLDRFARAGYEPIRVPVLEDRSLHERKSGARIVSDLYQVSGASDGVCLRPEMTAGIVRAWIDAAGPPPRPWRVSYSGPVFRMLATEPGVLREFHQVGVERLEDHPSGGDAEAIWLAAWSLAEAGIADATIRIGHAGLIRDVMRDSGLPLGVQVALVEVLGEAAQGEGADDRLISAAESHLEGLAAWLAAAGDDEPGLAAETDGADRLFRTLYPEVVGRRSGRDILARIRRKWDLGHGLAATLADVRRRIHDLGALHGPASDVLDRLRSSGEGVATLRDELASLVESLTAYGVDADRIELDLGFGRGIGFYSQMMFDVIVAAPSGPIEVCGGGRYDGLARALGSPLDVGGVGFAFGLERLRDALDARGAGSRTRAASILLQGRGAEVYSLAAWLRTHGRSVILDEAAGARPEPPEAATVVVLDAKSFKINDVKTGTTTSATTRDELLKILAGGRA